MFEVRKSDWGYPGRPPERRVHHHRGVVLDGFPDTPLEVVDELLQGGDVLCPDTSLKLEGRGRGRGDPQEVLADECPLDAALHDPFRSAR